MSYSMEDNQNAAPGNVVPNKLGGGARKGGDQQAAKRYEQFRHGPRSGWRDVERDPVT